MRRATFSIIWSNEIDKQEGKRCFLEKHKERQSVQKPTVPALALCFVHVRRQSTSMPHLKFFIQQALRGHLARTRVGRDSDIGSVL
jgi:hypothetical protein